jgi:hypothetical protein
MSILQFSYLLALIYLFIRIYRCLPAERAKINVALQIVRENHPKQQETRLHTRYMKDNEKYLKNMEKQQLRQQRESLYKQRLHGK